MQAEAERELHSRRNILVSGEAVSGKITLLNALIDLLPEEEHIVAIEDTLGALHRPLQLRPLWGLGFAGGRGGDRIRGLVRHALRHCTDHIVVGEARGGRLQTRCKSSTRGTAALSGKYIIRYPCYN